jgi:hypothetical protein
LAPGATIVAPVNFVLSLFPRPGYRRAMTDPAETLTPVDPNDLAAALAFALRYSGRKRVRNADELMAEVVAKRLVEHMARAGFVVMKRPPIAGGSAIARGFER